MRIVQPVIEQLIYYSVLPLNHDLVGLEHHLQHIAIVIAEALLNVLCNESK